MSESYYDILGVPSNATDEEIKKFLDTLSTVYLTFSVSYFVLVAVNVGYIVKCVVRRDKLNCY